MYICVCVFRYFYCILRYFRVFGQPFGQACRGVSVVSAVSATSAASDAPPRSASSVVLESSASATPTRKNEKPSVPQQSLFGKGC